MAGDERIPFEWADVRPDSWLLTGEVAKLFGVGAQAVRQWERLGKISATRTIGGVRMFRGADVLRHHGDSWTLMCVRCHEGVPKAHYITTDTNIEVVCAECAQENA